MEESLPQEMDPKKVCLIISHLEKPIAYEIYLIDVRDIGCDNSGSSSSSTSHGDDDNDWTKQQIQNLTPAIELPSDKFPTSMGFFHVGSRVYIIGSERVKTDSPHTRSEKNTHLDCSVYFCDTSSPPPLSVIPAGRMNSGKSYPFVSHVNGKFYVLSKHPSRSTHFTKKTPLFESFEPNSEIWSVLPNPPFYHYGEYVYPYISPGVVDSRTVIHSMIFFCTAHKDCLYAFDTDCSKWRTFELSTYDRQYFPFRRKSPVSIPDYNMWSTAGYPLTAHALIPQKGLVSKGVEGLTTTLTRHPSLSYAVNFQYSLDPKNKWFCLLKSGCHAQPFAGGKPSVLACVFRLVENRKDTVAAFEVYPFPPCDKSPTLEKSAHLDHNRVVGETPVLAAADLRCSLFKVESKYFEEDSFFVASFLL